MQSENASWLPDIPRWLVWLIAFYFAFYQLGGYAVLDNNEGLYAEIAREMLHGGSWHDWVIPHLNGLAYMEKPPLLYWLTAISFLIFGENEWSVRLVPALAFLGCVGLIMQFARTHGRDRAGKFAAVMFASGLGVTVMARTLMFDMLLTVFLIGAVMSASFYLERREPRYYYRTMALLALALLAKGFVALILFAAIIGTYTLLTASSPAAFFRNVFLWLRWRGILLFLLIAAPWHIAASLAEPIFPWFYFINEHVLRFLGKREPHDYYSGSWWYYLPRMLVFLFPWSFFLPALLRFRRSRVRPAAHLLMFLAWSMPLLFFSVSSAKANYYLVTTMPLAAVQLAFLLEDLMPPRSVLQTIPAMVLTVLGGILLYKLHNQQAPLMESAQVAGMHLQDFLMLATALCLVAGLLAAVLALTNKRIGVYGYLLIPALMLPFLIEIVKATNDFSSTRTIATYVQQQEGRELFLFRVFEQQSSLPFYLKKPVRIVDSRSADLFWGNRLHENNIVITDASFRDIVANRPVLLLVPRSDLADFEQRAYAGQFRLLQRIGDTSVFSN